MLTATEEAQVKALIAQNAALLSLASREPTIISKLAATKVSLADLTAATTVADSDLFLVRQGSTEKSVSRGVLASGITPPDASTTVKGIVELATVAEAQTGTDTVRAVTPAGLAASLANTGIGAGQTWQNVTSSRALGTTYTNSTGKPIMVAMTVTHSGISNSTQYTVTVGGVNLFGTISAQEQNGSNVGQFANATSFIVPNGATYIISLTTGVGDLMTWSELR